MSILSSTNSGRIQAAKTYFESKYGIGETAHVIYDIYKDENSNDFSVILKPREWNGRFRVQGEGFPCKIKNIGRSPLFVRFEKFITQKHLSILPEKFYDMCLNYEFSECLFGNNSIDFVYKHINHIQKSKIFIDLEYKYDDYNLPYNHYLEKKNFSTLDFISTLKNFGNSVYIRKTEYDKKYVIDYKDIGLKLDFDIYNYRPIDFEELGKLGEYRNSNCFVFS